MLIISSWHLLAATLPALAADTPSAQPKPPSVQVVLVASSGKLKAGQPLWLAARYTIEPGWHIYWENPGDSGQATELSLELPEGWARGPVRFPGPERFVVPGDLVNYGYEGTAALMVSVTPDKAGKVHITGSTRYLACNEDRCVPGSAQLSLDVGAGGAGAKLDAELARLPVDGATVDGLRVMRGESSVEIVVRDVSGLSFFPSLDLERAVKARAQAVNDGRGSVRLDLDPTALGPDPRAVLRLQRAGRVDYVEINLSNPRSAQ